MQNTMKHLGSFRRDPDSSQEIKKIEKTSYTMKAKVFKKTASLSNSRIRSAGTLSYLCNHIPLIAQLILPHKVCLFKLHFPQNGHVRVNSDPEERRVSTAEKRNDGDMLYHRQVMYLNSHKLAEETASDTI